MTERTPPNTRSKHKLLLSLLKEKRRNINHSKNIHQENNKTLIMPGGADEILQEMGDNQLRAEILHLRDLNNLQNEQLRELRQGDAGQESAGDRLIRTLLNGFRGLNMSVKPPKFVDSQHPKKYLSDLIKFFNNNNIAMQNRVSMLDNVFEDRAADWFETQKNSIVSFDDFQQKFLAEFFSVPVRVQMKSQWLSQRFESHKESLNSFFLRQVNEAQYIEPKLEAYEIHYTIVQQLPLRVREIMAAVDFADFNKISQTLTQLDLTFHDKTNSSKKLVQNNPNKLPTDIVENKNKKIQMRQIQTGRGNDLPMCNCASGDGLAISPVSSLETAIPHNSQLRSVGIRERGKEFSLPDMSVPPPNMSITVNRRKSKNSSGNLNW